MATYDYQIRPALVQAGYKDSDIGYDPKRKMVTVQGKDFLGGNSIMNVGGSSFTDRGTFDNALKTFQAQNQPTSTATTTKTTQTPNIYQGPIFTPAEDMSWQQRLVYYAGNPDALRNEYNRAQQALGVYQAMGDKENERRALDWINKLTSIGATTIPGGLNTPTNPADQRIENVINTLLEMSQNRQSINPYATPEYAAAQAQAQRAAQDATRAVQEAFGTSGMARSSALGERVAGINNEATEYLMTQVVPQIIAQEESRRQQEFQNLMNVLNPLLSQQQRYDTREQDAWERAFREQQFGHQREMDQAALEQQQRRFDEDVRRWNEEFAYRQLRDQIADQRYKQEFDEDVRRWGLQFALDKAYKQGQLSLDQARLALQRSEAAANRLMDIWRATGVAPEGIPGVTPGTPYYDPVAARQTDQTETIRPSDYKTNPDFAQDVQYIKSNPKKAMNDLKQYAAQFIQAYGYDGYRALINELPKKERDELLGNLDEFYP